MAKDHRPARSEASPPGPSGAGALLRDTLSRVYDSSIVYAAPVVFADRAVIPAARIASGGGGGFGSTPLPDAGPATAGEEGGGMGHGVYAHPVGFIEVTAEGSRWVPAVDVGRIVTAVTVAVVLVAFAWSFRRRPRRR